MINHKAIRLGQRVLGVIGVLMALPFFLWLPLGWLDSVPSMIDVFGTVQLRAPASFTVMGLLLAAVGFSDL